MMEVEYVVDCRDDKTLLDDEDLEQIAYSSDDDDEADYKPIIHLDPYPEHLDITKSHKLTEKERQSKADEYLKNSVIVPGFEKLHVVPPPVSSVRAAKKERKKVREKTKGPDWFNLPVQEMTEEVKNDIELLKMRSVLNPKQFYKNNDITHTPKYFQVGTVIEGAADFYSSRIPKAQRKRTLVDELLADAETRAYQKKKYKAVIDSTIRKGQKAKDHAKRLKKKK